MKKRLLSLSLLTLTLGTTVATACTSTSSASQKTSKEKTEKSSPVKVIDAEYMRKHIYDYKENPTKFVFKGERPAILDFYADWCGPCRQLSPRLAELAKQYEGKIDVYKINVDDEQELSRHFGVRSIPMLLFIPMKGTPIQHTGLLSKSQLEETIQHILK